MKPNFHVVRSIVIQNGEKIKYFPPHFREKALTFLDFPKRKRAKGFPQKGRCNACKTFASNQIPDIRVIERIERSPFQPSIFFGAGKNARRLFPKPL